MINPVSFINPVYLKQNLNKSVSFGAKADKFVRRGRCTDTFVDLEDVIHSPGVYPEEYTIKISENQRKIKPHYYVIYLYADMPGNGYGANAIKQVVKKSCKNKRTEGRVLLGAYPVDYRTFPAGFYYKLGFRFKDKESNDILRKWLACGGTRENAPEIEGQMYLPKRNISHCLSYKSK